MPRRKPDHIAPILQAFAELSSLDQARLLDQLLAKHFGLLDQRLEKHLGQLNAGWAEHYEQQAELFAQIAEVRRRYEAYFRDTLAMMGREPGHDDQPEILTDEFFAWLQQLFGPVIERHRNAKLAAANRTKPELKWAIFALADGKHPRWPGERHNAPAIQRRLLELNPAWDLTASAVRMQLHRGRS
jgi:hypothetical protein